MSLADEYDDVLERDSNVDYNYEGDLRIDLNNLHLCLQGQAENFAKWGKLWADSGRAMRRAEERVKTIRSEWILDLRLNWRDHGFAKEPTGPQAEAFYRTQQNYIDAKKELIRLQSDRDDFFTAKQAFQHMKDNMGEAQRLYHDEYWTTPVIERETSENLRRSLHEKELEGGSDRIPK